MPSRLPSASCECVLGGRWRSCLHIGKCPAPWLNSKVSTGRTVFFPFHALNKTSHSHAHLVLIIWGPTYILWVFPQIVTCLWLYLFIFLTVLAFVSPTLCEFASVKLCISLFLSGTCCVLRVETQQPLPTIVDPISQEPCCPSVSTIHH